MIDLFYKTNFVCPHCKKDSHIQKSVPAVLYDTILSFQVTGYSGEDDGPNWKAESVDIEVKLETIEPDQFADTNYICDRCGAQIDPEIKDDKDLFNWLREEGMVEAL